MGESEERFQRAIAQIDAANAEDPTSLAVEGASRPKELVHAEMMTAWVQQLEPAPSEALLLAARGHHIRRWEHPRSTYPEGRGGYLRWRSDLHRFHAGEVATILREAGYGEEMVERVGKLVRKEGLGRDREVQVLEDALCLVFMETQFNELSGKLTREKMVEVVRKTWRKMSADGRERALAVAFTPDDAAIVRAALAGGED